MGSNRDKVSSSTLMVLYMMDLSICQLFAMVVTANRCYG